jgi:histidine ammonia-lyase
MLDNARAIVAIELLAATRGIGFRRPLTTSNTLEDVVRAIAPASDSGDRFIGPDIERVSRSIANGTFASFALDTLPTTAR